MGRFEIGDRVLYCPFHHAFRSQACEAEVIGVERFHVKLQLPLEPDDELPEDGQLEIGEDDVYLLSPPRRPFLEDVERVVRRRFHRRAADVLHRFWLEQSRLSTGKEDDAALTELLRTMKGVRTQALSDGDQAFEAVREQLRTEITGPEAWHDHYRSWLTDDQKMIWVKEDDLEAAQAMRERCVEAAERLGFDEVDL